MKFGTTFSAFETSTRNTDKYFSPKNITDTYILFC